MSLFLAAAVSARDSLLGQPMVLMALLMGAVILIMFVYLPTRYKRCPPNKVMVIYGRVGPTAGMLFFKAGAARFVWPNIQEVAFLDLTPVHVELPDEPAVSNDGRPLSFALAATVAVSTQQDLLEKAAERLLGAGVDQVGKQATDLLMGSVRRAAAAITAEQLQTGREAFAGRIATDFKASLAMLGLEMIDFDVRKITL